MSVYSIIPADMAYDQRMGDKHRRVMLGLGVHSSQKHWIKLSQTKLAAELGMARETVNRAIADLVEWNYLEKRSQKDTQKAICFYRIVMSRAEPDADSEELDVEGCDEAITGDQAVTGGCDFSDHTGVTPGDHTGVTLVVTQDVPSIRSKKTFNAGARARDAKAPPAPPAKEPEAPARLVLETDSDWWAWLSHVGRVSTVPRQRELEKAGRMVVFSDKPKFIGRQPEAAPATGSARHAELMEQRAQMAEKPGPTDRKMAAAGDAA